MCLYIKKFKLSNKKNLPSMIKRFYMLLQRHSQINYIKTQNH